MAPVITIATNYNETQTKVLDKGENLNASPPVESSRSVGGWPKIWGHNRGGLRPLRENRP